MRLLLQSVGGYCRCDPSHNCVLLLRSGGHTTRVLAGCMCTASECETVRERVLLSTDSSKKKIIVKTLTVLHIVWQKNTDKRLMIPVSPLMIGKLVQSKPNDSSTLMFQGFTEAGVSSVKHLWPAGSHWQSSASPLPGDIKCNRTVSSADIRFYKHQVKQPLLCKPTNHPPPPVCLCRPSVVYSPALFTQIRWLLSQERKGRVGWELIVFGKKDYTASVHNDAIMKHISRQQTSQVCNNRLSSFWVC